MYLLERLLLLTTLSLLSSSHWIRTWPKWANRSGHLKQKGETQTPKTAEPAKKRKSPSTGDDSDSHESDAEELLAANKRPKVVADKSNGSNCETSAEDESDSLLDEIAQSLTDTEKTAPNVTENLQRL